MFHKAINLDFLDGTALTVTFQDGSVRRFDMSTLFRERPQLEALKDRSLFLSGRMFGPYEITWDEDLDIDTDTIYEHGEPISKQQIGAHQASAQAVSAARAHAGISQKQLSAITGIDQSDLSKIERGIANPSVATLDRIAAALGGRLQIEIKFPH